ncbi:hypothetical protein P7C73_g2740, partial [Tremellales sp. Uapishka_1]
MDAKSLLRAQRATTKIEHPYATYTQAGQLKCSICAVPGKSIRSLAAQTTDRLVVKQWDAHLLTKQHRTSAAREKALQAKAKPKRPAEEPLDVDTSKRTKVEPNGAFPAGFFSSGNQPAAAGDEEEQEDDEQRVPSAAPGPSIPPAAATGDAELDDFLSSLADDVPMSIPTPATAAGPSKRAIPSYKTIIPGQASYEAAPVRLDQPEEEEKEKPAEESEKDKRERLDREEKEEIMGRLEEEERAQEDADSRVAFLKNKMEQLKKKREARIAAGGGTSSGKQGAKGA